MKTRTSTYQIPWEGRGAASPQRSGTAKCRAFTRLDLLAVLLTLMLCAAVVLPALASSRPRSQRVACANNLRQIGNAQQLWGNDHGDKIPADVSTNEGGTLRHSLAPNVWLHLSWISNETASPAMFLCPSDTGRPARDFSADPSGGYIHPNFANAATSYLLGYANVQAPTQVIAGDRNITSLGQGGCSRFTIALRMNDSSRGLESQWTAGLHNNAGNLLFFDGSVGELTSAALRNVIFEEVGWQDGAIKHSIVPR